MAVKHDCKCILKFIVGDGRVILGGDYKRVKHSDIAKKHGVRRVSNAGLADLRRKIIFGSSKEYGPYDVQEMKRLLPSWQVDAPTAYWSTDD